MTVGTKWQPMLKIKHGDIPKNKAIFREGIFAQSKALFIQAHILVYMIKRKTI